MTDFDTEINERFAAMEKKFVATEKKFVAMDYRLKDIVQELDDLRSRTPKPVNLGGYESDPSNLLKFVRLTRKVKTNV